MKRVHPLLPCVLSGLLLWAAWPVSPFTFLIFIAFVPLLWLGEYNMGRGRFFCAVFLSMLVWNIGTTWWVCHASLPGGIVAMLFSSVFMSLPWLGYRFIKKRLGRVWGFVSLIVFWLSFEYTYLNIQLSWPWLTLGNVFATHPGWVQWYEYTGSSGGTLWVLIVNILLFNYLYKMAGSNERKFTRHLWPVLTVIAIPLLVSLVTGLHITYHKTSPKEIVVIQPNIDPYEKFNTSAQQQQLQHLIELSESRIDSNTSLVVWPETALSGINGFNEDNLQFYPSLTPLWLFLDRHPQITLYTGIEGFRMYSSANHTASSRQISGSDQYVDVFNSATLFNTGEPVVLYHKSKLVPGVETMPTYLKFLDKWFEQFGGTSGGYASQEERTVLNDTRSGYKIAPAICYESIYGEFLTPYIRNGANIIGIITNDGWWHNTAGYRQHMQYARLRAIETRRWVVRSANTGISCFIDPYGKVYDPQPWDTAAAIKMNVPMETRLTFFVKHEDLISKAAFVAAGILLLWGILLPFTKRTYGKNAPL